MSEMYWKMVGHWASRDDLLDKYWDDPQLIKGSQTLARVIKELAPKSVYEIGMYNGRNLNAIHSLMPDVKIGGCDVNKTALEFARQKLPDGTVLDNIDALNVDLSETYDLVFTHGVLMHIAPEKIRDVIARIIQKSNRFMVHVERGGRNNHVYRGPEEYGPDLVDKEIRWSPDVAWLYKIGGYNVSLDHNAIFGSKRHEIIVIIDKEKKYK